MKIKNTILAFTMLILGGTFSFAQNQTSYGVVAENGNGLKFWNNRDEYKIHMGNSPEYKYGPVTDYSIKCNMNDNPKRGWTWGIHGRTPIAALNTIGNMKIAGNFSITKDKSITLRDANHALAWYGSTKIFDGFAPDGPVLHGYRGGILGVRQGSRKTAILHWTIDGVGIGTRNTGAHLLAVAGSIGCKAVRVTSTGWADFVFATDYDLPTLEEVEQHIADKGHLPAVPSEVEVMDNGISLGEMDATLLQKIEELTLYTIEQNKQINNLLVRLKNLENGISESKK